MPRDEAPVEGEGQVQHFARELRRIRERAGKPAYRKMQEAAGVSHATLARAARGKKCPPWGVAKAFADVCDPSGDTANEIYPLWEAARRVGLAGRPQPDFRGAAKYVASLRELHAWAGRQSRQRPCKGCKLPTSTLGDALSLDRTTLPTLRTVKFILATCLDDEAAITQWLDAWGKLDPLRWSPPGVSRSGGASRRGARPAAAGISPSEPTRPVPPDRCTDPGCGAPERIWDWKPPLPRWAGR
jgi:hypothetical protein